MTSQTQRVTVFVRECEIVFMWPLTPAAQCVAAHVFRQHGPVALQLLDNALVDGDVISAAADTAAEIHLHRAASGSSCAPLCVCTASTFTLRSPVRLVPGKRKKAREVPDVVIDSPHNHVLL